MRSYNSTQTELKNEVQKYLQVKSIIHKMPRVPIVIIPNSCELDDEAQWASINRFIVIRISEGELPPQTAKLQLPTYVLYRGYMLSGEQYTAMYHYLARNYNMFLIITPNKYELAHYFPNSYPLLKEGVLYKADYIHCANSCINEDSLHYLCQQLRKHWNNAPILLKDFVKSGSDNCAQDTHNYDVNVMREKIETLIESRGKKFNRGVVIKEYVPLKRYRIRGISITNEWRSFVCFGKIMSMRCNSFQKPEARCAEPPVALLHQLTIIAQKFHHPYITIDVAELADKRWTIIECGDGSVSGIATNDLLQTHWKELRDVFL